MIPNVDTPAGAIRKALLDMVRAISSKEKNVGDPVFPGEINLVLEERFASNLHHWLGEISQPFLQPGAFAASDDDKLHGLQPAAFELPSFELLMNFRDRLLHRLCRGSLGLPP